MSAYNYAAAFVAFSQGSSFDDISARLGIPLDTLKTEARQHGWKKLNSALSLPVAELSTLQLSMADIDANRKKSLKDAEPLEMLMGRTLDIYNRWWEELGIAEELDKAVQAALSDAIEAVQTSPSKENQDELGKITANAERCRADRDALRSLAAPSPKALAELAKAVSTIHEIRYRAVGDLANKSSGEAPTKQSIAQIIVNMPGAISQPRERRVIEVHPPEPQELGDGT